MSQVLPPGRQRLPREFIALHQRARIVTALVEETAEKGYRAVTVADLVRRAAVARSTFYDNFSGKEECFLAAAEMAVKEAQGRVIAAAGEVDSWPARVNVGLNAFLGYVASEPALARTCIVEVFSAGPAAIEHYESSLQAFMPLFRMGRKVSPRGELPETLEETIVGGIFWTLYRRIVFGRADEVQELLPELVKFSLTPYLGVEGAKRMALRPVSSSCG